MNDDEWKIGLKDSNRELNISGGVCNGADVKLKIKSRVNYVHTVYREIV